MALRVGELLESDRRASPASETVRAPLDVSVVIPCLNEEASIGACVRTARFAITSAGLRGEVVVVDNGSTDRSVARAARAGARVVREDRPGYGSAYCRGFAEARGRAVLMGDGDGTYDFRELPRFMRLIDEGADLVMGSRLRGRIMRGAMPWSHRWVGVPALTWLLNAVARTGVSDAHCGLRMIRRSAAERLNLCTSGMEFASEMIIKARRAGLRIAETPIVYAPRPGHESASKLHSLRDGLRHVACILSFAPAAPFLVAAAWLAALGAVFLASSSRADVATGGLLLALAAAVTAAGRWLRAHRAGAPEEPGRSRPFARVGA